MEHDYFKLEVKEKTAMGYILENGVEIVDTFAEMYRNNEIASSVLDLSSLFLGV